MFQRPKKLRGKKKKLENQKKNPESWKQNTSYQRDTSQFNFRVVRLSLEKANSEVHVNRFIFSPTHEKQQQLDPKGCPNMKTALKKAKTTATTTTTEGD